MASIRRGYSDDFTLKNNSVGIGTSTGQEALDVVDGAVKGQDLKVTGISSFTAHEGFLRADHQIAENTTLSFDQGPVSSLSDEIIVGTGQTVTVTENLKEDRLGPELITNGQFLSNVDDWTANNSSNSFNNGRLRITRSGGDGRVTYQLITNLVSGATYFASAIVDSIGSRGDFRIVNGNSWTSNYYLTISGTNGQVKLLSGSFTATSTTALVGFAIDDDSTVIEVDQVTVKRVNDVEEPGTNIAGGSEIECLKVYNTFTPPSGGTNERPYAPKPGELYYNYDLKTIEFFDGNGWRQVDNTTRSGRGVFGGGVGFVSLTEFVNISTQGNSTNFGTLTVSHNTCPGSLASSTRGMFAGGDPVTDVIDYITIASEGNAQDFGNLFTARLYLSGSSSSTRGIFAGGFTPTPTGTNLNIIDYITIATIGNALEFGDLISPTRTAASCSSPVRSVFSGGYTTTFINTIQFVTISSTGNSVKFGELSVTRAPYSASCSSTTRGLILGGVPVGTNAIDSITISSTGNAVYFGDLTGSNRFAAAALSSNTRGLCGGGGNPGSSVNIIDYVTIATSGNAQDFGDLSVSRGYLGACSDSHGGLGGF